MQVVPAEAVPLSMSRMHLLEQGRNLGFATFQLRAQTHQKGRKPFLAKPLFELAHS